MIRLTFAAAILVVTVCIAATARADDTLDRMNASLQHRFTYDPAYRWADGIHADHITGNCTSYAFAAAREARAAGYDAQVWQVEDERGEQHAVALVGQWVLDNRFWQAKTRAWLERRGYRFEMRVL